MPVAVPPSHLPPPTPLLALLTPWLRFRVVLPRIKPPHSATHMDGSRWISQPCFTLGSPLSALGCTRHHPTGHHTPGSPPLSLSLSRVTPCHCHHCCHCAATALPGGVCHHTARGVRDARRLPPSTPPWASVWPCAVCGGCAARRAQLLSPLRDHRHDHRRGHGRRQREQNRTRPRTGLPP
jgi:hypothetical protein